MLFFGKNLRLLNVDSLTRMDYLYIDKFSSMSKKEQIDSIEFTVARGGSDFIVRIAANSPIYRQACLSPELEQRWLQWWSSYGVIITQDLNKAFYPQDTGNTFDLFLSAYFYHKSLIICKESKNKFSYLEQVYLKKSISYQSVLACQKYHRYLYEMMDEQKSDVEKSGHCLNLPLVFKEIITQIKGLLPAHGSYAYLMLTEAFLRYALYLKSEHDYDACDKAINAALKACENAKITYSESDPIIFNASLGKTIAESNSFLLSDFGDIEKYIIKVSLTSEKEEDITNTSSPAAISSLSKI